MTHAALLAVRRAILAAIPGLGLVACESVEPFEYHSGNEIPEGPGVFSGEEGDFVIYRE